MQKSNWKRISQLKSNVNKNQLNCALKFLVTIGFLGITVQNNQHANEFHLNHNKNFGSILTRQKIIHAAKQIK